MDNNPYRNSKVFCAGCSTKQLMKYAEEIRTLYDKDHSLCFNVLKMLDTLEQEEKLGYEILEDSDATFKEGELAKYSFEDKMIYIKESVYNDLCNNEPRNRFTVMHELAHYYLMDVKGRHPHPISDYEFKEGETDLPTFVNPEWQANSLAGFVLVPDDLSKGMSIEEVCKTFNVSPECAALNALKRIKRDEHLKHTM